MVMEVSKMEKYQTFGDFFKVRRIALRKTLRNFCQEYELDPGNISKIERGKTSPPASQETLKKYAEYLEINPDSPEWEHFFDLAAAYSGRIPKDIQDAETLARLPIFFRTIRDKKFSEEKLDQFFEKIKES
jgi:transcriptional regulator with XRE-family HTH domain